MQPVCVSIYRRILPPGQISVPATLHLNRYSKSVCTRSEYCYRISDQQLKRIDMAGHDCHLVGRGLETGFNEAGFGRASGGRNCARVFVVFGTRDEQ
jgi:hypothetical protein